MIRKNLIAKILLFSLSYIIVFSGCDTSHVISVETYKYNCRSCSYKWVGNGFVVNCPDCESPSIEMIE